LSDKDTAPGDSSSNEEESPDSLSEEVAGGSEPKVDSKAEKQENPLVNIMVNVLIPVVALTMLSKNPDAEDAKLWHIGALKGMLVAVAFPLCYGIYDLVKRRKVNFFSILGLVSVLLTGGLTLFLWEGDSDKVADNAAVLFGIKEACIPIVFGFTILLSHWTKTPLVRIFLYTPELFDIPRIEKKIRAKEQEPLYEKLIFQTTLVMSASFFISAVANFYLAQYFLHDATDRAAYNAGVGKLTGWGFAVIGLPCMILWMGALFRLIKGIKNMTGLDTESIMVPR